MNNENIERIKIELEKLSKIDKISSINNKLFTVDYLEYEYDQIVSARRKNYPTYKSEYRVIKTLIRQRNQLLYDLRSCPEIVKEFVPISAILNPLLKSIGEIFSTEKEIINLADEFDKQWSG